MKACIMVIDPIQQDLEREEIFLRELENTMDLPCETSTISLERIMISPITITESKVTCIPIPRRKADGTPILDENGNQRMSWIPTYVVMITDDGHKWTHNFRKGKWKHTIPGSIVTDKLGKRPMLDDHGKVKRRADQVWDYTNLHSLMRSHSEKMVLCLLDAVKKAQEDYAAEQAARRAG